MLSVVGADDEKQKLYKLGPLVTNILGLFKNLFKKKVILSKEEIKELADNSSNLEIKKLLENTGADYESAKKICQELTNVTLNEKESLITLAKAVDLVYKKPNQAKEEFLRIIPLKKELFLKGETAQEAAINFYKKQPIPWNNKERLHFFLVLFYASCLEKGENNTKKEFSKLIQHNLDSLETNADQAHKLLGKVKVV